LLSISGKGPIVGTTYAAPINQPPGSPAAGFSVDGDIFGPTGYLSTYAVASITLQAVPAKDGDLLTATIVFSTVEARGSDRNLALQPLFGLGNGVVSGWRLNA